MDRRSFLASGAAAAGSVAAPRALRAQEQVLRFSHAEAPTTPKGRGAELFRQRIEALTGGRVRVELFPSSELVPPQEEMEALALGQVQIIAPPLSHFGRYAKSFQLFDLPFLFRSTAMFDQFQASEAALALRVSVERLGFVGLAYWREGPKQLSAARALRLPKDADGLRFATAASVPLARQFEILRAVPVPLPYAEFRGALANGQVDGLETSWARLARDELFRLQPFMTETGHGVLGSMPVVSTEFWRALPEDLRAAFRTAMDDARQEVARLADQDNRDARDAILRSGATQAVALQPDERQAWIDATRPVVTEFQAEIGEDLVRAVERAAAG
ncbi:TRAP transporter substrate-binding protein DctP [Geminicoccus harenae]|uniref:TRAP transporter substrate-binding protein DctP n=1 Tax=Geminicoccus harenae TaxID=2498453 RepID=UPI00168B8B78|nr:TRAP transporter substrate-binding protein DctP [Geminicoccus harenae]